MDHVQVVVVLRTHQRRDSDRLLLGGLELDDTHLASRKEVSRILDVTLPTDGLKFGIRTGRAVFREVHGTLHQLTVHFHLA